MSTPLNEICLLFAALVCLVGSAALGVFNARRRALSCPVPSIARACWRIADQGLMLLAGLCVVIALFFSVSRRHTWPFEAGTEVILASAAAAILWRLLCRRWGGLASSHFIFHAIVAGLLVWGMARWPSTRQVQTASQPWLFVSHLALALACGAFIEAGSTSLARLLTQRQVKVEAGGDAERYPILLGLALLTASMLLQAFSGFYTRGVYWSWTIAESWQLIVWLFYFALWSAFIQLGWPLRRSQGLAALGLLLTLWMLRALGA